MHARAVGVPDDRPATIDAAVLIAAVREHLAVVDPALAALIADTGGRRSAPARRARRRSSRVAPPVAGAVHGLAGTHAPGRSRCGAARRDALRTAAIRHLGHRDGAVWADRSRAC